MSLNILRDPAYQASLAISEISIKSWADREAFLSEFRGNHETFIIANEGLAFLEISNENFLLVPGKLFFIPKDSEVDLININAKVLLISIQPDRLAEIKRLHPEIASLSFFSPGNNYFIDLPQRLSLELLRFIENIHGHDYEQLTVINTMTLILLKCQVCKANENESEEDRIVRRFIRMIEKDKNGKIPLYYYAISLGLDPWQLKKACLKSLGKNPKQIIQETLLGLAEKMLLETNLPINEVMQKCGFKCAATFTMYFRRKKGCTPTEFRNKVRFQDVKRLKTNNDQIKQDYLG